MACLLVICYLIIVFGRIYQPSILLICIVGFWGFNIVKFSLTLGVNYLNRTYPKI
jgi:hypothetical protein